MNKSELKTCPYCGGKAEAKLDKYAEEQWYVECTNIQNCPILPCTVLFRTKEEAIEAWNTRAERTCHRVNDNDYGFDDFECSKCGAVLWSCCIDVEGEGVFSTPKYCPWCGRKVVKDGKAKEV